MKKNKTRYRVTIAPPNAKAESVFAYAGTHWNDCNNFRTNGFGRGGYFFIYLPVINDTENAGYTENFKRY